MHKEGTIPNAEMEAELIKVIEAQRWKTAKTYAKTAPHAYIVKKWNPKVWDALAAAIDRYGVDQEFRLFKSVNTYRYLYIGDYRYWHYEIILNRTRADQSLSLHTEDPKPDKQQRTLF
jgi:hypothetical protein